MVRAVRLAAGSTSAIEPATLAGDPGRGRARRPPVGRADRAELEKLLRGARRRSGSGSGATPACSPRILPELAAQRGIPQNKIAGRGPVGPHAARGRRGRPGRRSCGWPRCSTTSASRRRSPTAIRRPRAVGAELAAALLDRLREPRRRAERVVELVRHHMFSYEPNWSDAAVRRFIADAIGPDMLEELLELREADNIGSGLPAGAGDSTSCGRGSRRELAAERRRSTCAALAVDGDDLMAELGVAQGPLLGRILDELLERGHRRPGAQRAGDAARLWPGTCWTEEPMIELLLAGRTRAVRRAARSRRDSLPAGRERRPAQLDRGRRTGARRARSR